MNVVGIIAEYNPMHNGHLYHIAKAKELAKADRAVIIMSGSFTEQGNISVINKLDKASIAIENGADLVIELPTIYATSSSENFAYGAVKILNNLGIITHLAFGAETDNLSGLQDIAKTFITNKEDIICKVKTLMQQGINSISAYNNVLSEYLENNDIDFSLPNNILAIEYLKALILLKSKIKPVLVKRLKSNHSDSKISNISEFASSTSIRNVLSEPNFKKEEKLNKIKPVIPENVLTFLKNNNFNINDNLWNILRYEIIKLKPDGLKNIYEIEEGLENKLYKEALTSINYNDFVQNVKSKRYTLGRIKRICIYIILNITKEKYSNLKDVNYARILKVKEDSINLLSEIDKYRSTILVTKVTEDILTSLDNITRESILLDILATNISNSNNANIDYTNKIKQPWKFKVVIFN